MIVKETDSNKFHDTYDYVIVGAGIGGLVIANYLAREKYKVLILEQHYLVGGCCTTFSAGRQYYNAAACHLANMGEGQPFRSLLQDLGCFEDLNFKFFDENDAVLFKDRKEHAFFISPSILETQERFCSEYPRYSENIKRFFSDFFSPRFMFEIFSQSRVISFKDLLISYEIPISIVEIFDALFLAYYTRTTDQTHPYAAKLLLENTIFSTRAMPNDNQLQSLSNLLADKFLKNGGHLKLRTDVCSFDMSDDKNITFCIDTEGNKYHGNNFIANTSPENIYPMIRSDENVGVLSQIDKGKKIIQSRSYLILYLSSKTQDVFNKKVNSTNCSNIIYSTKTDNKGTTSFWNDNFVYITKPYLTNQRYSLDVFVGVDNDGQILDWKDSTKKLDHTNLLIDNIKNYIDIDQIDLNQITAASPLTIRTFTKNPNGSVCGYSFLPENKPDEYFKNKSTVLNNLFFVGHWVGPAGVDQVALNAKKLFMLLKRDMK